MDGRQGKDGLIMRRHTMRLSESGKIGTMTVRNRIVMPAMGTNLANPDGSVSQHLIDYYEARAAGGAGLIITEVVTPEERGQCIHCELGGYRDSFVPGLSRLARAVQSYGAKCVLQIAHAGAFASSQVTGMRPIAPSPVPCGLTGETPEEATIFEINEIQKKHVQLAVRAKTAGFDGVEIHGAHGYLLLQFLSPYTNKRNDDYGGSFERRLRFSREIVQGIRSAIGANFPIIYRLSAEEYVPDGLELSDTKKIAQVLEKDGIDAFHISAGTWDSRMTFYQDVLSGKVKGRTKDLHKGISTGAWVSPLYAPEGLLVHLAEGIKKAVSVPVIAVNSIPVEMAENIVAQGKADFVSMGRGLIADPELPNKVMSGRLDEIRRCLRCNECLGKVIANQHLYCAINAQAGNERRKIEPAKGKKKLLVVGGGPAGLEAARVASMRGHKVEVWEKESELGGQLRRIALMGFKKNHKALLDWYVDQLRKLGVEIKLNKKGGEEGILSEHPDVVVLAAGAEVKMPDIQGIDSESVCFATNVLDGKIELKNRIVIIGGGLVGCELALKLADNPVREVTVVEMLDELAIDLEPFSKWAITGYLAEKGVRSLTGCKVSEVMRDRVVCVDREGQRRELPCDNVILATGLQSSKDVSDRLGKTIESYVVGDNLEARNIMNAVHDGFNVAMRI